MPPRRSKLLLAAAAALAAALLLHGPASAFSQFGSPEEGVAAGRSKEGIIAVPLPPLPGTEAPAAGPGEGAGTTAEPLDPTLVEPLDPTPVDPPDPTLAEPRRSTPDDDLPPDEADRAGEPKAPAATPPGATPPAPARADSLPSALPPPRRAGEATSPDAADDAPTLAPPAAAGPQGERGAEAAPSLPAAMHHRVLGATHDGGSGAAHDGAPGALRETAAAPAAEPVDIRHGDDGLPHPVRDLRERLMAIAQSGEIERLRPYIETGEEATVLSFGSTGDDPIAFLRQASGDAEGLEILAILLEVLESGHVRVDAGSEREIFVWPYFTQLAIEQLTRPQMVELFELVTAGDYEAMKAFGAYNFYRAGISPNGKLQFFVAGD